MKNPIFAAITAIALLTGCQAASKPTAPAPRVARPAMWKMSDADTTVYLFGTVHVLPTGLKWRSALMDKAIADSSALVLEVGNLDDTQAIAGEFQKLAITPNLPNALDRVPRNQRATLASYLKDAGLPDAATKNLETWAIALTVSNVSVARLKLDPASGADRVLNGVFKAANKPVTGLEGAGEQLGFFDHLTEKQQRDLLTGMLTESTDAKAEFDKMFRAWQSGDEKAIAETFDDETKMSKELTDALLYQRNANWVKQLSARMAQPGTIMVAVGAGHLAGPGSVVDRLRRQGFKVVRIQ